MKLRFLVASLMMISPVIAGDPVDAVNRLIRASGTMNDTWLSTCLAVARDSNGKDLCTKVHSIYAQAIKESLK